MPIKRLQSYIETGIICFLVLLPLCGQDAGLPPPAPVDFTFSYSPYRNRLQILADIRGLPETADLKELRAIVEKVPDGGRIAEMIFDLDGFTDGRQSAELTLPRLSGEYQIRLQADGRDTPEEPVVRSFSRQHFAWENNPAGRSTKVYHPFTPIEVRANTLRTVLRKHILNAYGLWDQVQASSFHTSKSKALLAAPMRYVIKARGLQPAEHRPQLTYIKKTAHQVVTRSRFYVGSLAVEPRCTWDYDGCMRVDLKLLPTESTVEILRLEIPLQPDQAALMHAATAGSSSFQTVPAGDGPVWDSRELTANGFIPNFCPYIYIGNGQHGICWFAENDRDWGWDPETPNIDIIRRSGQVLLRIHLINQPTKISRERTLSFGLLAAPVKPRLSPQQQKHWWRYRYLRDNYIVLGRSTRGVPMGLEGSLKPFGGDVSLWHLLKHGNQKGLKTEDSDAFFDRLPALFSNHARPGRERWKQDVAPVLTASRGKKTIFYNQRTARRKSREYQTFQDEWELTRKRPSTTRDNADTVIITPSESYIDYALHWYAKSFEEGGSQGVYWDKWEIQPSVNTVATEAYRRANGTIVPAAGIWAARELCKRTFILQNELEMLPVTMPHSEKVNLLPMISFATLQHAWGWEAPTAEAQNRYSRAQMLLAATGELAGTWPVLSPGSEDSSARRIWQRRDIAAMRLLHELDGGVALVKPEEAKESLRGTLIEPILKLLDEKDLVVYRYWDDRPVPIRSKHPDIFTIVYCVPGTETIAAVVGYAPGDVETSLEVDWFELGMDKPGIIHDYETSKALKLKAGRLPLRLPRHGLQVLRLTPSQ